MSAWDGIDEFVTIATAGNFTRAARQMNVSTTHMSRAIMRLETRVQTQLIVRTTRTVRLTEAGTDFLEICRKMIEDRDNAILRISEHGEPEGDLRITCSTFMGEKFVAPIVRRFATTYPGIRVIMTLTNRLVDLVTDGYDLAVRTGSLADSRLIGSRIGSRSLLTCASPSYLAQAGPINQVRDLDSHQCLVGTAEHWHFRQNGKDILYRPKGRWRCDYGSVVLDAAIEGMGICQLPDFYLMPHIKSGALEMVLDQFRSADEPIWVIYPQHRHVPSKVVRLIEQIKKELPILLQHE